MKVWTIIYKDDYKRGSYIEDDVMLFNTLESAIHMAKKILLGHLFCEVVEITSKDLDSDEYIIKGCDKFNHFHYEVICKKLDVID